LKKNLQSKLKDSVPMVKVVQVGYTDDSVITKNDLLSIMKMATKRTKAIGPKATDMVKALSITKMATNGTKAAMKTVRDMVSKITFGSI